MNFTIVKFEEPKLVTIKEIVEAIKEGKHYVERFEYGDYANWVEAAVVDIDLSLKYTKFCPNSIYGAKWAADLKSTYKSVYSFKTYNFEKKEYEDDKKWDEVKETFDGYSNSYYLDHLEDIYETKVEVIGYITERD